MKNASASHYVDMLVRNRGALHYKCFYKGSTRYARVPTLHSSASVSPPPYIDRLPHTEQLSGGAAKQLIRNGFSRPTGMLVDSRCMQSHGSRMAMDKIYARLLDKRYYE